MEQKHAAPAKVTAEFVIFQFVVMGCSMLMKSVMVMILAIKVAQTLILKVVH